MPCSTYCTVCTLLYSTRALWSLGYPACSAYSLQVIQYCTVGALGMY